MVIKPIIYIVLGVVIGIALARLFTATSPCRENTAIKKASLLKEQTSKKEIHFQKKVDSLGLLAKDLKSKLNNSKAALEIAKNKTLVLQTQLLASKEKEFVSNEEAGAIDCPHEEGLLTEFIEVNTYKDSIYESIDSTRVQQLQNKDASLAVKDSMYNDLKVSFDYSISQQELLFAQNKLLRRQLNRRKVKGKLVSGAVLIVCASAVRYLVR